MTIEEIERALTDTYGEDYTENGCFINGVWLSVSNIIEILKRAN